MIKYLFIQKKQITFVVTIITAFIALVIYNIVVHGVSN
jgi:hypothetical protein